MHDSLGPSSVNKINPSSRGARSASLLGVADVKIEIKMADQDHQQPTGGERFVFQFTSGGTAYELSVPVPLPIKSEAIELAIRLIHRHGLPCYLQDKLATSLNEWARQRTIANGDIAADSTMKRVMSSDKVSQYSHAHPPPGSSVSSFAAAATAEYKVMDGSIH